MYILGDIGNSDTKIFLVNKKDRILKRTSLISKRNIEIELKKIFEKNLKIYKHEKR